MLNIETKLQKIGVPFAVATKLASYGKSAIDAYNQFQTVKSTFSKHKNDTVPMSPSQKVASETLNMLEKTLRAGDVTDHNFWKNVLSDVALQDSYNAIRELQKLEDYQKGIRNK